MSGIISTTAGVLLAAGRGRRMGRLKQVLPWGDSSVVAAAFDGLARVCGAGVVVVVGDDGARVAAALGKRAFHAVESDSDAEQLHSARLGLRRALGLPGVARVLLHPADHPVIPPRVVDELLRRSGGERALIPTCRGRGGHPVLIPSAIAEAIISWAPEAGSGGLRDYWRSHPQQVRRIEFPESAELVMDLDTPEDYTAASE